MGARFKTLNLEQTFHWPIHSLSNNVDAPPGDCFRVTAGHEDTIRYQVTEIRYTETIKHTGYKRPVY
jgi:hypothetical protein